MTVIKHKNSTTPGKEPLPGDLERAEIAINLADGRIFTKDQNDQIIVLGGEVPSGGTGDRPTSPNTGEIFYDTTTGSLVYWDGSAWQEISSEPTDGEGYVKISGDTMTGQLNIGGTNIQLKTDGSAEFAGSITNGPAFAGDRSKEGCAISSTGTFSAQRGGVSQGVFAGYNIADVSQPTSVINNDGSAEFTGNVVCGAGTGVALEGKGAGVFYRATTTGTQGVIVAKSDVNGTESTAAIINADGSAEFAGDVEVTSATSDGLNASSSNQVFSVQNGEVDYVKIRAVGSGSGGPGGFGGDLVFSHRGDDTGTFTDFTRFNYDGSAEFAGQVQIGGDGKAGEPGLRIEPNGLISVTRNGTGAEAVFAGYPNGSTTATSVITADGSAEFAGGNITLETNGSLTTTGNAIVNKPAVNKAFITKLSGTETSSISSDGSAEFAGSISSGPTTGGDVTKQGCYFDKLGGVYVMRPNSSTDNVFSGYQLGNTSPTVYIGADGSATFTGTINGETIGTSDERFKENITPANPQLADVTALGGILKNFDWNADAPVNEEIRATRQLGLVAQEVADICPQLGQDRCPHQARCRANT